MKKLNDIIEQNISEFKINKIEDFKFQQQLIDIILEKPNEVKVPKYRRQISLNKSEIYSYECLNMISKEYGKYFLENKYKILFDKNAKDKTAFSDVIDDKPIIYIPIKNTIEDSYAITHEMIHDMSVDINGISDARYFLCEVFSLLSEFLQTDYFKKNNIKEYKYHDQHVLNNLKNNTKLISFEIEMLSSYLKYGYIEKTELIYILEGYKNDWNLIVHHLENILETKELCFWFEQRYCIGYLIACYMHNNILSDNRYLEDFIYLNSVINEVSIEYVFKYLNIEFFLNSEFNFMMTEKAKMKLRTEYKNHISR